MEAPAEIGVTGESISSPGGLMTVVIHDYQYSYFSMNLSF